jgi:hypothetical protein
MHADRVEVSWDSQKSNWLVRIEAGEEVVRRHLDLPREAAESELNTAALKTARDEGYEATSVTVARAANA